MLDLSIIIINWNTRQMLADCLNSIEATVENLTFEVMVVDNGSTDGSQTMLAEQFSHVHLIQNHKNVGFARANNQAMAVSQGRYMLLLNSDALLLPQAVQTTLNLAEATPRPRSQGLQRGTRVRRLRLAGIPQVLRPGRQGEHDPLVRPAVCLPRPPDDETDGTPGPTHP